MDELFVCLADLPVLVAVEGREVVYVSSEDWTEFGSEWVEFSTGWVELVIEVGGV